METGPCETLPFVDLEGRLRRHRLGRRAGFHGFALALQFRNRVAILCEQRNTDIPQQAANSTGNAVFPGRGPHYKLLHLTNPPPPSCNAFER